jgi:hypothetical protein
MAEHNSVADADREPDTINRLLTYSSSSERHQLCGGYIYTARNDAQLKIGGFLGCFTPGLSLLRPWMRLVVDAE